MIRLYVDTALDLQETLALSKSQSHYLDRVMRLSPGDCVCLFDNKTGEWRAQIAHKDKCLVILAVKEKLSPREEVPDLWLMAAPIKRGRFEWVAEKACELGVRRFIPVLTGRTIAIRFKPERLWAHMTEAAEQCGRTALPQLDTACTLEERLEKWPSDRQLLFCDETGGNSLRDVAKNEKAAILIGPEGGFDPEELCTLRAHPGAARVSLGKRVLRADTAAVAALALWQEAMGDCVADPPETV